MELKWNLEMAEERVGQRQRWPKTDMAEDRDGHRQR